MSIVSRDHVERRGMDRRRYDAIAEMCTGNIASGKGMGPTAQYVKDHFKDDLVSLDTVSIIYRQQYQRHIRRTSHVHRRPANAKKYVRFYEEGRSIFEIAAYANFSPYLLARILLEHVLPCSKKDVSKFIKNLQLIRDERLRRNVTECVEMDEFCSPYCDRIRRTLGLEYEYILQQSIKNARIPFDSEDNLRQAGWSKTPDVKLQVPICVRHGNDRSYTVNWIDSKAMFGDPHTHESENLKQLQGYLNRFGTGMVIYWFGFVKDLNSNPDILVCDRFPDDFVVLGRETTACGEKVDPASLTAEPLFSNEVPEGAE